MRLLAITTFNRIHYLKQTIESWNATKNKDWIVVVADDGSTDGTLKYLKSINCDIIINNRRGIHHQTNSIFKYCENLDFEIGFKIDDDLLFKKSGWDDLYCESSKTFDHLVFHDPLWKRVKHKKEPIILDNLECKAHWDDTQGALWTFTPKVIATVGYFDLKNFGLCGFGHRDYTFRCCKAGFNVFENIFDIKNSNEYIELNKKNYISAPDRDKTWHFWNTLPLIKKKYLHFNDKRLYVPYNEQPVNIYNKNLIPIV
jgi:glycosyltransferase involved in cell wall biosynthesis